MKNKLKRDLLSDTLKRLAIEAGESMRAATTETMNTRNKSDGTPVTDLDVSINDHVTSELLGLFSDISIIGEEGSHTKHNSKYTVVLDPIDGTGAFCNSVPISTFCASMLKPDSTGKTLEPRYGLIYDPFCKRLWSSWSNEQTTCNNRPVRVSSHVSLVDAKICIPWWRGAPYSCEKIFEKLTNAGAFCFVPGSIAHYGGLVAQGTIDATIYPGKKAWETPAMQVIVEGSGGKATDIFGNPLRYGKDLEMKGHVISNSHIHDQIIAQIHSVIGSS